MSPSAYRMSTSADSTDLIMPTVDVLVATAVDVELRAVIARLKPLSGSQPLKKSVGANTYYFGAIGRYRCAVMMTEMGSGGPSGSGLAVLDAIKMLTPKAVSMVGIAFGRDQTSQQLGDLLIAKQVIPYERQRLGQKIVPRAAHPEAGPILLNRARNLLWVREAPDGSKRAPIFGAMLSGEKLLDDDTAKGRLFEQFPQAIGGAMEAAGVADACHREKLEWLVAKAICDWADGKKTKDFQPTAASISADFLEALLNAERVVDYRVSSQGAHVPPGLFGCFLMALLCRFKSWDESLVRGDPRSGRPSVLAASPATPGSRPVYPGAVARAEMCFAIPVR